jgi:hypothetical protein
MRETTFETQVGEVRAWNVGTVMGSTTKYRKTIADESKKWLPLCA